MASNDELTPGDAMDTSEDITQTESQIPQSTGPSIQIHEPDDKDEDLGTKPAEIVVGIRRNANGTIGSVFSGNKIRHLKKEDGLPLWRKDIQHDFLREIFDDPTPCFTEIDGTGGHTFSEVFIGAMQRSSKTSKVLKDKLLNDKEQAVRMAMICLLVNIGRMNTTLNFFPEMRAQLRTYHAIPSLQADQDPNAQYKGLQDAPRLKSILKGACEDTEEPNTIEKIKAGAVPRTNIVNLIFVLSQHVQKVSELHFEKRQDFFDLVIQANVSSKSRARAFLWLMWWYMQSDFTREDALQNNPFGAGQAPLDDPEGLPIKVPELVSLTDEEAALENVDTPEELAFGEEMRMARKRILEEEDIIPVKKTAGPSPARSEIGRTRENTPDGTPSASRARKSNLETSAIEKQIGPIRLNLKTSRSDKTGETSSPAPTGPGHTVLNSIAPSNKRSRPETSHQKAINLNRKMHVDKILFKKWNEDTSDRSRKSKYSGLSSLYCQIRRINDLPEDYDTDEEEDRHGPGGLTPNITPFAADDEDDFGADARHYRKVLQRSIRRIARDYSIEYPAVDNSTPNKAPQTNGTRPTAAPKSRSRPSVKKVESSSIIKQSPQGEDLDDLDMDLLGEGQAAADDEPAQSSDETDDADLTEDDFSYADPYATLK